MKKFLLHHMNIIQIGQILLNQKMCKKFNLAKTTDTVAQNMIVSVPCINHEFHIACVKGHL